MLFLVIEKEKKEKNKQKSRILTSMIVKDLQNVHPSVGGHDQASHKHQRGHDPANVDVSQVKSTLSIISYLYI